MADGSSEKDIFAHQEWLGFVQPIGVVVAPTVMVDAQVVLDSHITPRRRELCDLLEEIEGSTVRRRAPNVREIFTRYLGWEDGDLVDATMHRETLERSLPELGVVLSATWAVPTADGANNTWMMLVRVEEDAVDLDKAPDGTDSWNASRHARFERLMRETEIPIGLLCTDERLRLIYAPKGESSGHLTFELSEMAQPAGGPILSAFDMLLSAESLFRGLEKERLPTLLAKSREAQAEVSTKLSRQVLAALYELLRGFVTAHARTESNALIEMARERPGHLYGGLITALMRLVFVLYAEDRGLMPDHPIYQRHYSLGGLFSKLRGDTAAWPDTMEQRFGAWAQLLALFRLIHAGGAHAELEIVARRGALFDPDRFPFLEGRTTGLDGTADLPRVPDSTVWKVLQNLMMLDSDRLSYRTLDVEQIGSVYEAIMGFRIELTGGWSIAVRSQKRTGAAVNVNLDELLNVPAAKRVGSLGKATDQKLKPAAANAFRAAETPQGIVAALDQKVDRDATPGIVPPRTPVLQPTDERRRSGSHYTPRSLTEPIVTEALRPIFERLGEKAKPEEILDLKVLDPATGSGAFLVEACRQLAARLVDAWAIHGGPDNLPSDEDELLHALRLVAQRCLYGVDRNPMAIDLARLSLWLATLAKDHEFTFIDHTVRYGDSLLGLTRRQIEGLDWGADKAGFQEKIGGEATRRQIVKATELHRLIREAGAECSEDELQELYGDARAATENARLLGDLTLAAFFTSTSKKTQKELLAKLGDATQRGEATYYDSWLRELNRGEHPFAPFHWELEFPEVFERDNSGFDTIVGNPPFAGKNTVSAGNVARYPQWLKQLHRDSHGNADLVAHFFRRAFNLLRNGGTFGMIATNTIAQGDTRATGLRWICKNRSEIYRAIRRHKWPGLAAVVVSVVHVQKGPYAGRKHLNNEETETITAFLLSRGNHDDPEPLKANARKSFQGSIVLGMGFTFDDKNKKGEATPLDEMHRLIAKNPLNADVIRPYIGGEEVNTSPRHAHHRYVINFQDYPLRKEDVGQLWKDADAEEQHRWVQSGIVPVDYPEPVAADWPELLSIIEVRMKGTRASHSTAPWWQFERLRPELYGAVVGKERVLVVNCGATPHFAVTFLNPQMVFANSLDVFPLSTYAAFCAVQSRTHEIWARLLGSSMKDDLRYTPSDCFETFPFPAGWESRADLEAGGRTYYKFRAKLMVENKEGLTKTYNRFHDPEERDTRIAELRKLHEAMDRAVLRAYGWNDLPDVQCEFIPDYEVDEEGSGRTKKPWRYRWPDEVRDEVLMRLLALNRDRARDEKLARDASAGTRARRSSAR